MRPDTHTQVALPGRLLFDRRQALCQADGLSLSGSRQACARTTRSCTPGTGFGGAWVRHRGVCAPASLSLLLDANLIFFFRPGQTFNFCLMFDPEGDSDTTLLSLSASLRSLRSGLGNLCYRGASKVRRLWRRASAFAKANQARSFGQQKKRLKLSDLIASSITPTISSSSFSLAFFAARDNSTNSTHPLSLDSPRQWGTHKQNR